MDLVRTNSGKSQLTGSCALQKPRSSPSLHKADYLSIALFTLCPLGLVFTLLAAEQTAAISPNRQLALDRFNQAVEMRGWLEAKAKKFRTVADYLRVIDKFKSVYYASPESSKTDDALLAVAQLYYVMANDFKDFKYFYHAAKAYAYLEKEYPSSPYCSEALFALAEIYLKNLNDPKTAQEVFKNILKKYPDSVKARTARARLAYLREGSGHVNVNKDQLRPVHVNDIRFWVLDEYTRIVINADNETEFVQGRLDDPARIFLDVQNARLSASLFGYPYSVDGPCLRRIRVGQARPEVARVVLELAEIRNFHVFTMHDPFRIVVDLQGMGSGNIESAQLNIAGRDLRTKRGEPLPDELTTPSLFGGRHELLAGGNDKKPEGILASSVASPKNDGTRSLIRTLGLKIGRIVIDPGHGGFDTGTIGPSGLQEKELVLDISLKLKRLIEEKLGGEVILTRQDDTFIPLETRTEMANQSQADLFISIHANSSRDSKVRGVETFFLDFASSADVEEIAARENASSQKTVFELQDLVKRITLREKVDESREFAQTVQKSISKALLKTYSHAKDRGIKQAPFIVLIGANMPSILTEVSFVSNPADEKLLKSSLYRQRVAEALCNGIRDYTKNLGGIKTARVIH
jgi:N-acetylmuramoyl-L-alanine amidase/tetratricopeptide (TPR) repeat protein